jgi:hypothetical protein
VTDTRPAAPAPAAPPVWGRLFVGCAVVGGLLVLGGMAAFAYAIYWLTSAGRQAPTLAVVGPQSAGTVRFSDLAADPGTRALIGEFMARAQSASSSGGPQLPKWMRDMQAAQARQGITQWLPRETTLSFEPREDGTFGMSAAVNPRGMVQPFRLALMPALSRENDATVSRHGRHQVVAFRKNGALCFMDGTIVWAPDTTRLRSALDRLEPAIKNGAPAPDPARTLPGQWDVSGWLDRPLAVTALAAAVADRGQAIATALELADAAEPPAGLRDLRFGLDLRSNSDTDLALDVAFASAEEAAAAEPALTAAFRRRIEQEPGLTATVAPTIEAEHVRYAIALRDLDQMIARRMAERPRFERR